MKFLLDSDTLSDLYDPSSSGHLSIATRLESLADSDSAFISILAIYELEYGYAHAPEEKKPALRQTISDLQVDFPMLPLTAEGARVFGSLKKSLQASRQLSKKGSKSHNVDLMLAATAMVEGCVLVSADSIYRDLRELNPLFLTENWLI
ncbi:MAG TPA: type II toxin-antitoxin system VapC family toxin [Thermoanaerobaculia bacterium]